MELLSDILAILDDRASEYAHGKALAERLALRAEVLALRSEVEHAVDARRPLVKLERANAAYAAFDYDAAYSLAFSRYVYERIAVALGQFATVRERIARLPKFMRQYMGKVAEKATTGTELQRAWVVLTVAYTLEGEGQASEPERKSKRDLRADDEFAADVAKYYAPREALHRASRRLERAKRALAEAQADGAKGKAMRARQRIEGARKDIRAYGAEVLEVSRQFA